MYPTPISPFYFLPTPSPIPPTSPPIEKYNSLWMQSVTNENFENPDNFQKIKSLQCQSFLSHHHGQSFSV